MAIAAGWCSAAFAFGREYLDRSVTTPRLRDELSCQCWRRFRGSSRRSDETEDCGSRMRIAD
jgi:hypothetical protein